MYQQQQHNKQKIKSSGNTVATATTSTSPNISKSSSSHSFNKHSTTNNSTGHQATTNKKNLTTTKGVRYEIITEVYEEQNVYKSLSLILQQSSNRSKPTISKHTIPQPPQSQNFKVGTILRFQNDQPNIVPNSEFELLENGNIKIGSKLFHKPICGSGFIIYNEKGEIFLAKNGSCGMLSFIYLVGALAILKKHGDENISSDSINSICDMIRIMSNEDKLSIRNMVNDIDEVKSVFKCWMTNKRSTTPEIIQQVIETIMGDIIDCLNSVVEDPQECGFHNYSFIKGALNSWKLSKMTFQNLNEMYLQNALIEFDEEMQNDRNDIDYSNALNNFIDFRFFNAETRNDFETIPLFQRFYLVKCKEETRLQVKTLEYNNETSKFYPRNPESNTWLELPKFMREEIVSAVDRLTVVVAEK